MTPADTVVLILTVAVFTLNSVLLWREYRK